MKLQRQALIDLFFFGDMVEQVVQSGLVILGFQLFGQAFIRQGDIVKEDRRRVRFSERASLDAVAVVSELQDESVADVWVIQYLVYDARMLSGLLSQSLFLSRQLVRRNDLLPGHFQE